MNIRQSMDGTLRNSSYSNNSASIYAVCGMQPTAAQPSKCEQQSQQQQAFIAGNPIINHRKSHSLDANSLIGGGGTTSTNVTANAGVVTAPITAAAIAASATTKSAHCNRERYVILYLTLGRFVKSQKAANNTHLK